MSDKAKKLVSDYEELKSMSIEDIEKYCGKRTCQKTNVQNVNQKTS